MTEPTDPVARCPRWVLPAALVAVLFGLASVVAGGRVLFGSAAARAAEGDFVPFVLWFNFAAGFAYVVAGVGLARGRAWAARLAFAIAVGTPLTYAAFGVHVLLGGAFTRHTVVAMALRTTIWVTIATLACRRFGCLRARRVAGVMTAATIALVGASTCGRPAATVAVHATPSAPAPATGRARAPSMAITDHQGRVLEVPVPGKVTVLSFASRTTADAGSERCRGVRVAHPAVEVVELMDVSSAPGFLASKVKRKLAERHATILADTRRAFAAAQVAPPADFEARIHIVADWNGDAFRAYGATHTDTELQIAVIDASGGLVELFAKTPSVADLDAAIVRARDPR